MQCHEIFRRRANMFGVALVAALDEEMDGDGAVSNAPGKVAVRESGAIEIALQLRADVERVLVVAGSGMSHKLVLVEKPVGNVVIADLCCGSGCDRWKLHYCHAARTLRADG